MKMNNFRGNLTDISATKEPEQARAYSIDNASSCLSNNRNVDADIRSPGPRRQCFHLSPYLEYVTPELLNLYYKL